MPDDLLAYLMDDSLSLSLSDSSKSFSEDKERVFRFLALISLRFVLF